jgi:acylphosphatase
MSESAPRWTVRYRAAGSVQGVGFRPFVHQLATAHGLSGWVRNDAAGAEFELTGIEAALSDFLDRLRRELPAPARLAELICVARTPAPPEAGGAFRIEASGAAGDRQAAVLPDLALCAACRRELFDPTNRRHRHPFITCTRCGPRFSIITRHPLRPAADHDDRLPAVPGLPRGIRRPGRSPLPRPAHQLSRLRPALAWWDAQGQPVSARRRGVAGGGCGPARRTHRGRQGPGRVPAAVRCAPRGGGVGCARASTARPSRWP